MLYFYLSVLTLSDALMIGGLTDALMMEGILLVCTLSCIAIKLCYFLKFPRRVLLF